MSLHSTYLEATFLAIDKRFLHQELPTTINQISATLSRGRGIVSTLTDGIQDIAAILPLLETDPCELGA